MGTQDKVKKWLEDQKNLLLMLESSNPSLHDSIEIIRNRTARKSTAKTILQLQRILDSEATPHVNQ